MKGKKKKNFKGSTRSKPLIPLRASILAIYAADINDSKDTIKIKNKNIEENIIENNLQNKQMS